MWGENLEHVYNEPEKSLDPYSDKTWIGTLVGAAQNVSLIAKNMNC